jgi:hypothetical protein
VRSASATAAVTVLSVAALGAAGCNSNSSSTTAPLPGLAASTSSGTAAGGGAKTPTSAAPQPADYTRLLIKPHDILAPGDSYAAQQPDLNPNGTQGAQVLLTNHDQTRAIGDSIVVLPAAAAAPSAMQAAIASLGTSVTDPNPQPSPVGAGGTVVSGMSPDRSKTVTILLFTEGPAFARLEFVTAPGESTPADFVTDVGQKQDIALRTGIAS